MVELSEKRNASEEEVKYLEITNQTDTEE